MKVSILGAVTIKTGNKAAGGHKRPKFIPVELTYEDEEILRLTREDSLGTYGRHWVYAGDQMFHEGSIAVQIEYDDGAKDYEVFKGRTGLNDMVAYVRKKGVA